MGGGMSKTPPAQGLLSLYMDNLYQGDNVNKLPIVP